MTRNAGASRGFVYRSWRSREEVANETDGFTADRTAVSVKRSKLTMTDACPSPMAVGYARKDHAVTSADVSANASVYVGM